MSTLTVSRELKAYFAGIVDGEGSIVISKNNASSGQLYLRITVVNSNREVLELLRGIYEGGISTKKKYKTTDKQCWTWQVSSHKAKVFLFDIYEFLIIKKAQAEIAFRFIETFEEGKKIRGNTEQRKLLKEEMSNKNNYNLVN